jgi:hypothetical protein
MATKKNKLTTVFDGDDKPFQKKIKRVQGSVKKTSTMLKGMGAALSVGMVTSAISSTVKHFDRIGKIATRLNMSAEALQRLGHAAEMSGSNMEQLQGIMTRLERRTGEALQNTTGSQAQRFKELNIEVEAFSNLNPEDKILAIADAFNALGGTEKSIASLMGLLDTEVRELLPLLKLGSDGIQKMMGDISALTDEEVKSMEAAADAVTKFWKQARNTFGNVILTIGNLPDIMEAKMDTVFQKEMQFPEWRTKEDYNKFAYSSANRSDEQRELMRRFGTGELDVARAREAHKKRTDKKREDKMEEIMSRGGLFPKKEPSMEGYIPSIIGSKALEKHDLLQKLREGDTGKRGYIPSIIGSKALEKADFLNALIGGKENAPGIVTGKALDKHDLLQALMGGDTGAMAKATSSTSGRFGEFVAAATLGSGQGRMVSQRRGIRIEGIDKQTRILEDLRKHLDELAGNTTP